MWRKRNTTKKIDAFNLILNIIRQKYNVANVEKFNHGDFSFIDEHESEPESDSSSIIDTVEEIVDGVNSIEVKHKLLFSNAALVIILAQK